MRIQGKLLLILLSMGCHAPIMQAQRRPADHQRVVKTPLVHDPVLAVQGDTCYLFFTGMGIPQMSTTDFEHWRFEHRVFKEAPQWALQSVPGYRGHTWAPDVLYHQGRYHLFYSCSSFGKNESAIGHAWRSTLTPDSPEPWHDTGEVIRSEKGDDYNAIDPCVVTDDDGVAWMAFGSFWGGIKMVQLDLSLTAPVQPVRLWSLSRRSTGGDKAVEAPFIYRHDGYYYLFVSFGYCCRGEKSTYRVVVGRARQVTGPYLDRDGRDMMDGGGTPVISSTRRYVAVGHSAAYSIKGKDYFVAHGYPRQEDGASELVCCEMAWDGQGWPLLQLND